MKELKTLKDLKEKVFTGDIIEGSEEWYYKVDYEKIKAEAIKWIEEFKTEAKFEGIRLRSSERDLLSYVFKKFFNLTEEDLKC